MESHVTRVLIDPVTKRALGVEFSREGKLHVIRVRREVIISGGSVNSPQILMLSGIGPRQHLQVRQVNHVKLMQVMPLSETRQLRQHGLEEGCSTSGRAGFIL
jgi:glucose dehydrogenase (acceptor)